MAVIQLIQRQIPIGSKVIFFLKNGREVSGTLTEISRDHISLENEKGISTILVEMIGGWKVITDSEVDNDKLKNLNSTIDTETKVISYPGSEKVERKLFQIETYFEAHIQVAKLEILEPDFKFPEKEIPEIYRDKVAKVWNRVANSYYYAKKVNELSSKFGRIQPLVFQLEELTKKIPTPLTIRRHLAYLYYLLGKKEKSLEQFKNIVCVSDNADDWLNLAILAFNINQEDLACYALGQVFLRIPINKKNNVWFVYLKVLKKSANYPAIAKNFKHIKRHLSKDEIIFLLESIIYLLKSSNKEEKAIDLLHKWIVKNQDIKILLIEGLDSLDGSLNEIYKKIIIEFETKIDKNIKSSINISEQPQGYIHSFNKDRHFGFIEDINKQKYFFHCSAIIDLTLYKELANWKIGNKIPVTFEPTQGPKGPIALRIAKFRTIDELFELANSYAERGEYSQAINYIRQVLKRDPEYPKAQILYEKWREYARITGVPKGANPYARAKRAQLIEKDLERAAQLFQQAIREGDNIESAVKDLAQLYAQQGRYKEAIELLQQYRKKIKDQRSLDNLLVSFYQATGNYEKAIILLRKKINQCSQNLDRAKILWEIANCYLRKEAYNQAIENFREVLKIHPDNLAAKRNIAICYFKQERFEEAEKILNKILDTSPDPKAAELLEVIEKAKITGESAQLDQIIIETTLQEFTGELSKFTQFFLDKSELRGISQDRIEKDKNNIVRYKGTEKDAKFDLERLEEIASQLGTRRPRERAEYYLSAAKIVATIEGESSNQFYRYLCRGLASSGDAIVAENRHIDAARDLYCEALSVYDGYRKPRREDTYDEQDAVNALARFILSWLGRTHVPLSPPKHKKSKPIYIQQLHYIADAIEKTILNHPSHKKVFDGITYLISRSRYAANQILRYLYSKTTLQALALEYLKDKNIDVPKKIEQLDDFVKLWNKIRRINLEEWRTIINEFRLLSRIELTTASIGDSIERIKGIYHRLFFELDRERARQLQNIFEITLDLIKQISFEEQERLCIQIESHCEDLLREIETSPTRISIEAIYPVIKTILEKVKSYHEDLYAKSVPQIDLRLPIESYTPDNDGRIEIQIVAENKKGRSPAEALELVIQEDENLFKVNISQIKLDKSLRGGEQHIFRIPLEITQDGLDAQTFSFPIYAQYSTRTGDIEQTQIYNFSIRLYSEEDFEKIENPYAAYAEGGIVDDPKMFYGRDELIDNIAQAIQKSRNQSKSIVIFGQMRAGKSSVLYHLKERLKRTKNLLVIDLGNIGSLLDEGARIPFLYQLLWVILSRFKYALEDLVEERELPPLKMAFPIDKEFYEHPSPLVKFQEVFDQYKRRSLRTMGWQNTHVVLLIDEFSYIYDQIVKGKIPETFMKNWKALLQRNYFSVVMVGQDVMPKFKQRFPNEFGITQDERVSYLKREDAIRLIDEPIRWKGKSRYRERAIERILELTAGSPFYIQIICDRLVKYMNRKRATLITEADVEQVKNELIYGVNALGIEKFDNLISSGDTSEDAISNQDTLAVLKSIAIHSETGPCNRSSITCKTQRPIDIILDDLVNREVLERERGQYYRIRVGLFREWLVAHQ